MRRGWAWGWLAVAAGALAAAGSAHSESWLQGGGSGFHGSVLQGTELDSSGSVRLGSFAGTNLAIAARATSGSTTLLGSRSVTDGTADTEWRFDNQAEVLGETVVVDLGGDRGVSRVRIVPGKTIAQREQFYLKGYRLDVAPADDPAGWILVAQQPNNTRPTIDTEVDSTWIDVDGEGRARPVIGRYVRLRVTREDQPNWVTIGEVEVYGEGYRDEGSFESVVFDAGVPANFGRVQFAGDEPDGTRLRVQVRVTADTLSWTPWHRVPEWSLADAAGQVLQVVEAEPARYAQYRVTVETQDPLATPRLERFWLEYERELLASSLTGEITPLQPVLGEETGFTYRVAAEVRLGDTGFDRVRIGLAGEVTEVRVDGMPLAAGQYAAAWDAQGLEVALAEPVMATAELVVDFRGVLLAPTLAVRAAVGRQADGPEANLQYAAEGSEGWTLIGQGFVSGVLPRGVQVRPNPFNAARGPTVIRIDLAKVQMAQPVTVQVLDLAGRVVRTLWEGREVTAGRHRVEWDGRDEAGRLVVPGIYLVRVEVEADRSDVWVGTVGVVY